MAAFPPVEGDLADKRELAHVSDADRFEPPPPEPESEKRTFHDRLPKMPGRKKFKSDPKP